MSKATVKIGIETWNIDRVISRGWPESYCRLTRKCEVSGAPITKLTSVHWESLVDVCRHGNRRDPRTELFDCEPCDMPREFYE